MPSKIKFPVSLSVACNVDTGEEFILYTDREIEERDKVLVANIDQAIAAWTPPDTDEARAARPEAEEKFREDTLRSIAAATERFKADRDAAEPYAERFDFLLLKPTWGEHLAAKGIANIINDNTGEARFDEDVYARELLPFCVEGMKSVDVMGLTPKVGEELRFRLLRSMFPQENRLPFTLPQRED